MPDPRARGNVTTEQCLEAARKFYAGRPFVRVTDKPPHTKWASGSNLAFVSYACDPERNLVIALGAIDTACKAGNVEILGREKLGGGYITVLIKGDVAAVKAAIEAGREKVESSGLGKLIAAHVIPRPSTQVLSLLPKQS